MNRLEHDLTVEELRARSPWGLGETKIIRGYFVTRIEPEGIGVWVVQDIKDTVSVAAIKDD
ncbi:MAG: hypothetical protein ACLP5H_34465 [Desulfomonilaceae bacterium]